MKINSPGNTVIITIIIFLISAIILRAQDSYQTPPSEIVEILEAELAPQISISPDGKTIALLKRRDFPPISDLAQPELRLAGLRINPQKHSSSRSRYNTGISLLNFETGETVEVKGLPEDLRISNVNWSPDSRFISFLLQAEEGFYLWIIDIRISTARELSSRQVNDIIGSTPAWHPDSKSLLVSFVKNTGKPVPLIDVIPDGPVIQENLGKVAPSRTYQDLLKNNHDIDLFDSYCTSELYVIDLHGNEKFTGLSGIFRKSDFSPNGNYILIEQIIKPYSFLVPWYDFPYEAYVSDINGKKVYSIATVPSGENVPIAFGSVVKGPREFEWRQDTPATLYWLVAQDEGDASKEVPVRDKMFSLEEPFSDSPKEIAEFVNRFSRIFWGDRRRAIATDFRWQTRNTKVYLINPESTEQRILFDRSSENRYNNPGLPVIQKNINGTSTLRFVNNGESIYLTDIGASPEGNKPFLDEFNLSTGKVKRLFMSEAPYFERPIAVDNNGFFTLKESVTTPPNLYFRSFNLGTRALTNFKNPYPQLENVKRELISYKRKDGINLTATLYLPPGYNPGDSLLPVLMWAYPQEFLSSAAASQVRDSPYQFSRIYSGSPIFWVLRGFAVLDDPTMPVVGEEPNNSFVEQLVMSAEAAIDELVRRKIADTNRIAIGGHSYGAFMTANLLAHSDLFAAGIARSGAYNRTLTPFGFQSEHRTFWEAPEVYMRMSPFTYANKINEPLLLIHGIADNNSGTFPMQSERMYNAIKGHGGIARLVMLPFESHGYVSKESVYHALWETDVWLERWVKNKNVK